MLQAIQAYVVPVLSAFIVCATFLTVVVKPLRQGVINWLRKKTGSDTSETQLQSINDTVAKLVGANRSMLRNDITAIYYRYLDTEELPAYEKENLIELYESYTDLKGNHYIEQIFKDMMQWNVVKKTR